MPATLEPVTPAIHLQDIHVVGEAVQQCPGEPLRVKHRGVHSSKGRLVSRAAAKRTTGVSEFRENVRPSVQQESHRFRPRWYQMMALLELTRFAA